MKRLLLVLAALAAVRCFGVAASQAWVTNYVAQAIAGSKSELEAQVSVTNVGGVTTLSTGTGRNLVRIVLENATDAALQATNCSAFAMTRGITNGFLFVWNGRGRCSRKGAASHTGFCFFNRKLYAILVISFHRETSLLITM